MSFFKAKTNAEDVKESSSSYITASGMYPVTILAPFVSVSSNGSTSVDFYLEHEGQKQVIYGNLRISNNDGSENKIGSRLFNQLLVVVGLDDVADPVDMELPIGKKEADKVVAVLEDLMDVDVLMRVQVEYSLWNDEIRENRTIRSFFREDKASAAEVVSGENVGDGYERDMKYANNVTYNDGLTAENIAQWVSDDRTGNGGAEGSTPTKAPSFKSKRFSKK